MKRFILLAFVFLMALPISVTAEDSPLLVSRAVFCTGIVDHEPVDAPESIAVGQQTVYFFMELLNGHDQSVSHRWLYNDIEIANVPLKIGADRWRTWSTKQVWHLTPGTLKVQILDASGQVLAEKEIALQ